MKKRLIPFLKSLTAKAGKAFDVTKTVLSASLTFLWFVLHSFLMSLLSGGILFLVTVILVAFAAWLGGADSPRDVALTAGTIAGLLWSAGEFVWRISRFFSAFAELMQKHRVEAIMKQADD